VYIEDKFIYVEDILEQEPKRIFVRRDTGLTGEMPVPALAIETGVNPGEQPKIPPTYGPGCAEEPEDAVQTEEIVNEKNLRVATSMVSTSKNPDIRRMLELFPLHVVPLAIANIMIATVMCDISFEDFEPISTLSSDFANTIMLPFLQQDLRNEMLQRCCDMQGKSTEDKIEILRLSDRVFSAVLRPTGLCRPIFKHNFLTNRRIH
jgi:hypothetical protein